MKTVLNSSVLPLALIALVVGIAVLFGSAYWQGILIVAIVYAIYGQSINIVYGYLGYITFGHAAFLGLGAYVAGLLYVDLGINFWLAVGLAVVPSALLGGVMAFASLRLSGAYFAICSLAIAEITRLIAESWIDVTRGPLGVPVPRPRIEWLDAAGLSFVQYHLIIAAIVLGLVWIFLARLIGSPVGLAWRAIRRSVPLAEAVGIPTLRARVIGLVISCGLAALAGALLVPRISVLSPELFGTYYSAIGLLIVVIGGRGTLAGPIIGGLIFAIVPELLRSVGDYRLPIFAALLLAVVVVWPNGLAPLLRRLFARLGLQNADPILHSVEPVVLSPAPKPVADAGPLLQVQGLSKVFAGLQAVDGVTFSVRPGEAVGLMGPNGAGKTTSFTMIGGFVRPSGGTVSFAGRDLTEFVPHKVSLRGLVRTFQSTTLFSGMSVLENVLVATIKQDSTRPLSAILKGPAFRRRDAQRLAIAGQALELVGLADEATATASSLPYGKQKLLSVALALATEPLLILLDEPAAGLNPTETAALTQTLEQVRAQGIAILLVEHNVRMLTGFCDRIVVLHHGVQIFEGTPEQVRANAAVRAAYFGTAIEESQHA